jgi:hypothetical protein
MSFTNLCFAPIVWIVSIPKEGGWLAGLCLVADDIEPSTYRRCRYISIKVDSDSGAFDEYKEGVSHTVGWTGGI